MNPDELPVVADSYYDHDEYGTVKVLDYDADQVQFEDVDGETTRVGTTEFPKARTQDTDAFIDATEPADITIHVPPASLGSEEPRLTITAGENETVVQEGRE